MTEIIDRLRLLLQDENGEIWSDSELAAYINDGQNEYAERTKCLVNSFRLITEDGEGSFPDDFLDFKYGINTDGSTIYPATWEHLLEDKGEGFDTVEGTPTHIYDNLSSDGQYKTYPVMDQSLDPATDDSPWGIALVDGCTDTWGRIEGDDYEVLGLWGISAGLTDFDEAGEVYYSRYPVQDTIEVPDTLALVYYAAAKAFELETERQSLKISAGLMGFFERRTSSFKRSAGIKIQHNNNIGSWF